MSETSVQIIDYGGGNGPSVAYALDRLGVEWSFTDDPQTLEAASGVILPGVSSAASTMEFLDEAGFTAALHRSVIDEGMPFLGICVGLQILFERSEEGDCPCLGWLDGEVRRFPSRCRVPQMGWNEVSFDADRRLTTDLPDCGYFYFANSYYAEPREKSIALGTAEYGLSFTAAVEAGNICATQFHLEKSGPLGLALLRNWVELTRVTADA